MTEQQRCENLLINNGWALDPEATSCGEYSSFYKEGLVSVDINNQEIVLVNDCGDFCHLPVNYYSLVGALIEYRQIAVNYAQA